MEYEKEVVLSIRHRIEMYEQEQHFNSNAPDDDYTEVAFEDSHVRLGSRQRGLKLPSYDQDLKEMIGFDGFSDSLARFLRDYARVEVYGSDFNGDGFEGHQFCIYWCKVILISSCLSNCGSSITGLPSLFMQNHIRLPRNSYSQDRNHSRFADMAWIRTATRLCDRSRVNAVQHYLCTSLRNVYHPPGGAKFQDYCCSDIQEEG